MPELEVRKLSKRYGKTLAVDDPSDPGLALAAALLGEPRILILEGDANRGQLADGLADRPRR